MNNSKSERTLVTLANAGELVSNIALEVMGNEVADSFAGSPLTRATIHNLAQTRFQQALSPFFGVK